MSTNELSQIDLDLLIARHLFGDAFEQNGKIIAIDKDGNHSVADYAPSIYEAQAYDLAAWLGLRIDVTFEGNAGQYEKQYFVTKRIGPFRHSAQHKDIKRAITLVAGMMIEA